MPMQWLPDRWYVYVPLSVSVMGFGLPIILIMLADALPLDPDRRLALIDASLMLINWTFAPSAVFFLTWLSWVVPWIDSANPRLIFKHAPSYGWRRVHGMMWAPAALFALYGAVILAFSGIISGHDLIFWGVGPLVAAMILASWNLWFAPKVNRRLRRMTAKRQICFECGYDLRGNPTAEQCPECGAACASRVVT